MIDKIEQTALDAAKLLRELEKEAEKRVLSAVPLIDNIVSGIITEDIDHLMFQKKLRLMLKINGTSYNLLASVEQDVSEQERVSSAMQQFGEQLARIMVRKALERGGCNEH